MTKRIAVLLAATLLCAACAPEKPRAVNTVQATIAYVSKDQGPMGCMGTDWSTRIRLADGRLVMWCGAWGNVGDVLTVRLMSDGRIAP